ncbi:AMP-binding protein [Phosphitispora sp. TUW77]|uniref:AMP-binding protein n=1 Tax=Phosphitispora sp. TUW77 TaxID=3152361 RepID=UPI003AB90A91
MKSAAKLLLKNIIALLFRVKTLNFEKLKMEGKVIITPNHPSFLDGILLYLFLPKSAVYVINTDIARRFSFTLRFINHLTIDPLNPYAMKQIINLVNREIPVVLFPEGRISTTKGLMKIYEGIGYVALKTGAVIYPLIINGPEYSRFSKITDKVKCKCFPSVSLYVDDPVRFEFNEGSSLQQQKHEISSRMLSIMQQAVFKSRFKEGGNLFDELLGAARKHGWNTCIVEDINKRMSYRNLVLITYILGRKFKKILNDSEETIGVILPSAVAHVTTLFALSYLNKTPAIINFSAGPKNVADCIQTTGIKTVLSSKEFVSKGGFEGLINSLEKQCKIIYLEDVASTIGLTDKISGIFNLLSGKKRNNAEKHRLILFTSGSESKPKGVILKHSNILANVHQILSVIDLHSKDKIMNFLPMFHAFGLTAGVFLPILSGVPAFLYPSPLHYKIIPEMIYSTNSTIIFGTSSFLDSYGKYARPYDFYSIRYAFAGAEKLKEDVRRLWQEKFGIRIMEGYGCTETAPVLSLNTPHFYCKGTVGRFLPGIEYRVDAVEGINDGGKLLVKGPNVMEGYILYDQGYVPAEEWYDTGDVVTVDDKGYITIKSRLKRFAKISGEMVGLNLIEELAEKCFGPEGKYAAITVPDSGKGEKVILFVTGKTGALQEMRDYLVIEGYSMLWCPSKIVSVNELPLLGSGKIDYVTLKKNAIQGLLGCNAGSRK